MQGSSQGIRIGFVQKILAVAIAGIFLVIGVLSWTTMSYIERDIDENARKQLDLAINLELALIDEHLARLQAQAATVAENSKLRFDLQQGDFAAVAHDLRRLKQAMPHTHILTLVDPSGTVLARANSDRTGQRFTAGGLVSLALQGGPVASPEIIPESEWGPEGNDIRRMVTLPIQPTEGAEHRQERILTDALALVGAAPVKDDDGRVVAVVVAAEVLNQNHTIVDEVHRRTNGLVSATIALDGVRVTTNVKRKDAQGRPTDNRAVGTLYSIPVMESLRAGQEYRGRALVVDEWQKTVYVPLTDHTGRVIAGPYVGIPEAAFFALRDRFAGTLGPVAGLSIAAVIAMSLFIGRLLHQSFSTLREAAERIAQGDLTVTDLGVRRNDEIGDLARAFEGMTAGMRSLLTSLMGAIENLLQAVGRIGRISHDLGDSSQKVSASISEVSAGAQEQNESVVATTAIIGQVRQAIDQIAEGARQQQQSVGRTSEIFVEAARAVSQVAQEAQEVNAFASQALAAARSGGQAVENTLDSMNRISMSTQEVAESIRELGRHSQQIGEIVELIRTIAEQTNLLALNAAIEAARGGDHGRGFAVVAQEVRRLADRSSKATEDISALLGAIQRGVEKSVQAIEAGLKEVETGSTLGSEARKALAEILAAMERTNDKAQAIAEAAEQVAAGTKEAVQAMDDVAHITETNTAATKEMAALSGQMSQAMERIASVSEANAAAAQEVARLMEETRAKAEEIAASTQALARLAQQLEQQAVQFKV